jgi:hypothetical protein
VVAILALVTAAISIKFSAVTLLILAITQTSGLALEQTFEQPSRVFGDVRKPVLIRRVEPQCRWWKPGIAATSTLEVIIWKNGQVNDVKVVNGPETAYTAAAADALKEWRFRPATLNTQPVAVIVWFRVHGCWLSDVSYARQ